MPAQRCCSRCRNGTDQGGMPQCVISILSKIFSRTSVLGFACCAAIPVFLFWRFFASRSGSEPMLSYIATRPGRYDKGAGNLGYDAVSWLDFLDFQRECTLFDWFIADHITGATFN